MNQGTMDVPPTSMKVGGGVGAMKIEAVTMSGDSKLYGRFEIREVYKRNLIRAFVISTVIQFAGTGTYYGVKYLQEMGDDAPVRMVRIMKYTDLGPPPSLTNSAPLPSIGLSTGAVKPSIGIPVPVPDAQVNPEQIFATQQELSAVTSPASEGTNTGAGVQIEIDDPGIDEFIPVEKEPQIVKSIMPTYPEIALLAGIEGTVWVKVLVGKDGKTKRVVVLKEIPKGIFADAATAAAKDFVFTPAIMNSGPVAVWVAIPFKFTIKSKSAS